MQIILVKGKEYRVILDDMGQLKYLYLFYKQKDRSGYRREIRRRIAFYDPLFDRIKLAVANGAYTKVD